MFDDRYVIVFLADNQHQYKRQLRFIPRVGDYIGFIIGGKLGLPKVDTVVLFPDDEYLSLHKIGKDDIDAVVWVSTC